MAETIKTEAQGEKGYVSRKKPDTVAKCPGCDNWAFYREEDPDTVKCCCGRTFKPSTVKKAKAGDGK